MSSRPINDTLVSVTQQNNVDLKTKDYSSGGDLNGMDATKFGPVINSAFDDMHIFMANLFQQHNRETQYLSYSNQLFKLESYISNKLAADHAKTVSGSTEMTTTIHQVRQRYADKASRVFYNSWFGYLFRVSLLFVLLAATLACLQMDGSVDKMIAVILLVILGLVYIVWIWIQIGQNAMRDRTNPNTILWTELKSAQNGNGSSCTLF